ncbi:MAG TPA: HAD hydrolase-like protein [Candidatus Saccharimonadales bacterium]|nr:HAD hydrolase-like protein [Candidatus Saccharimonadales bacterium]
MSQIEEFYIIDFDRTLARTDDLRLLFESVAFKETAIPAEDIKQGELIYKNNFDVIGYLRSLLKKTMSKEEVETTIKRVKQLYLKQAARENLLEPYAEELLMELHKHKAAFGILTTGSEEWQQVKIKAAGLADIPHLIVGTAKKSELIASWKQVDGRFLLPDELSGRASYGVDKIIFVDDKPISFEGIPDGVEGFWVLPLRSAIAYDIKKLEVPKSVRHARGLQEVSEYLQNHLVDKA